MYKKKDRSLVSIILINLLVCVLVIAAGFLLLYAISDRILDNYWDRTDINYLLSQKKRLKQEQYDRIVAGGGYRFNGYFEIVDSDAKIIYSSNTSKHNAYTKNTLRFIPDSDSGKSVYVETNDSTGDLVMTFYFTDNFGGEYNQDVIIVTPDGNGGLVTYSAAESMATEGEKIDWQTLELLEKNSEHTYIQRHKFRTSDGETRYLLYHVGNRRKLYRRLRNSVTVVSLISVIAMSTIFIMVFAFRVIKKIRQPMSYIMENLSDFAEHRKVNAGRMDKSWPGEFRELDSALGSFEQSLIDSDNEKRQLEEEKQQILMDISHDLKTPATVIEGYTEALSDGLISEEEQKEYISIISRRSKDLTGLINTFFEYNKLSYNGFQPVMEKDDFFEFFREYFADRYEELISRGCTIDVDIPEDSVEMSFDHTLMRRCFDNIVNNSISHNAGKVGLYARMINGTDEITILLGDMGKGIDPDLRKNIFEPFVTENRSRTAGKGTGLGLSIARKIVMMHNGIIQLMPEGAEGCSVLFGIRLPKS